MVLIRTRMGELTLAAFSSRRAPAGVVAGLVFALFPLILLLGLIGSPQVAEAQYFGKNKVQYDQFDWSVIVTDHFNVYFYSNEEEAARDAARMAERSYLKLSKILDHEIKEPVPLILYASHTDFQQTNALPGLISEGTGGVTEFLKRRVLLPFTGSYAELEHVLTHELVHAFQVDILLGRERSPLSGRIAYTPPLWFMEGMAEYLSISTVDNHTRMWLRDGALEGYLTTLDELEQTFDIRVYRFGQSVFEHIDQRYGTQKIGELLKGVGKRGSLERAVQASLGISLEDLSKQWTEQVRKTYLPQIAEYEKAEVYGHRLTNQEKDLSHLNLAPAVSPDGNLMVFLSDRSLYNDIYLASAIDGKIQKKLVEGERSASFESLRFLQTSLAWSPDQKTLAFAAKVGGEDAIYLYDMRRNKVERRLTFGLDGILSPTFSPDGQRLVFVGLSGGRSDLFITSRDGKDVKRLTQDRFADRDPHWSPDGKLIAFTTDRGPRTNFRTLEFGEFRIATYDLETDQIRILPGQEGKNISPQWSSDGTQIAFVSDRTGVSNIYIMEVASGEAFQLTDILTGVTGIVESSPPISWSRSGKRLLFTVFERGGWDIYAIKDPLELMKTRRASESKTIAQAGGQGTPRRLGGKEFDPTGRVFGSATGSGSAKPGGSASPEGAASPETTSAADSAAVAAAAAETDETTATETQTTEAAEGTEATETSEATEESAGEADVTESEVTESAEADATELAAADSTLVGPPQPAGGISAAESGEEGPPKKEEQPVAVTYRPEAPDGAKFRIRDYEVHFSPDVLVGGGGFAPGLGVAGQFALGLSDVLGNHHIQLAANVFGNIGDSDVFLTYLNLEHRHNWGVALFQFRNDYLSFRDNTIFRFDRELFRGAEVFVSRPFSKFRRAELNLQGVAVERRGFFTDEDGDQRSGTGVDNINKDQVFFVKPGVAFITDNVLFGSTGPIAGARTRNAISHSFGDLKFTTVTLDARKYINIRQRYSFAFRLLGVSSFGDTPQNFRLGGPYTLRGYSFEQFRGHNVGLLNTEFRFPLIDQFRLGFPLPIELRGIRGVFFFDAGTAFNDVNDFNAFDGSQGSFIRFEDIAASYGFGARINLGFLILRYDLAQRTNLADNDGSARSTFAIGADF